MRIKDSILFYLKDMLLPAVPEENGYPKYRLAAWIRLGFVLPLLYGFTFFLMLRALAAAPDTRLLRASVAIWVGITAVYVALNAVTLFIRNVRLCRALSFASAAAELACNEIVVYLTGAVSSHALIFVIIAVAVYRVFFDYGLGLFAAATGAVLQLAEVLLFMAGALPAPLIQYTQSNAIGLTQIALGSSSALLIGLLIVFSTMNLAMNRLHSAQRRIVDGERRKACTDALTGLYNKRYFQEFWPKWTRKAIESGESLCAAMIDVDNFKEYNDEFGHLAGDELLRLAAATVSQSLREGDAVARFGGEEFVAVFFRSGIENGAHAAERIRRAVESMEGGRRPVTVSIGVAAVTADSTDPEALLECADKRLYEAKRLGRNRVVTR